MTIHTANIVTHPPCHACRYDLHKLALDGLCPECGEPIAESMLRATEKYQKQQRQMVIGCIAVGFGVIVVCNLLAVQNGGQFVFEFACAWAVVGMASLVGAIVLQWKDQYEIAVAVGIVMVLSIPAVLFNLFVYAALGSMSC